MSPTTSIHIDQKLYEQAQADAVAEHRSIAGQAEFWAKLGRTALDNPDLPVGFIAEALVSMAELRERLCRTVCQRRVKGGRSGSPSSAGSRPLDRV